MALGDGDKTFEPEEIIKVQEALIANGGSISRANGKFGPQTKRAIFDVQGNKGLTQDCILGTMTATSIGLLPSSQSSTQGSSVPLSGVKAQQARANQLLGQFGYEYVKVDGKFGPQTAQAVCIARYLVGLESSRATIPEGSEIEQQLLNGQVQKPEEVLGVNGLWIVLNKTCQVGIYGQGDTILRVQPGSSGAAGFETRNGQGNAFRFNPAIANNGWHNSTSYPSLDGYGNMYRPLYFDNGQAIHGANSVPRRPASKGCWRNSPAFQNWVIDEFLNYNSITEDTYDLKGKGNGIPFIVRIGSFVE